MLPKVHTKIVTNKFKLPSYTENPIKGNKISLERGKQAYSSAVTMNMPK